MCACVCACVIGRERDREREREREREGGRKGGREGGRERESLCACAASLNYGINICEYNSVSVHVCTFIITSM